MYSGIADAKERSEKVVAHLCEQFGFLTEELIAIILFSGPSSTAGEEDVVTQGCVNACTVESCAADGHKTSDIGLSAQSTRCHQSTTALIIAGKVADGM